MPLAKFCIRCDAVIQPDDADAFNKMCGPCAHADVCPPYRCLGCGYVWIQHPEVKAEKCSRCGSAQIQNMDDEAAAAADAEQDG